MSRSDNALPPGLQVVDLRPKVGPFRLSVAIQPVNDEDLGGPWTLSVIPTERSGYIFGSEYPNVTLAMDNLDDVIMHLVESAFPGVEEHYR